MNNPCRCGRDYSFLMSVGTLLTVFRFLTGRTAAVGTSDILFLLGLGLHLLAIVLRLVSSTSEVDAVLENMLKIVHDSSFCNGLYD